MTSLKEVGAEDVGDDIQRELASYPGLHDLGLWTYLEWI